MQCIAVFLLLLGFCSRGSTLDIDRWKVLRLKIGQSHEHLHAIAKRGQVAKPKKRRARFNVRFRRNCFWKWDMCRMWINVQNKTTATHFFFFLTQKNSHFILVPENARLNSRMRHYQRYKRKSYIFLASTLGKKCQTSPDKLKIAEKDLLCLR